MRQNTDLILEYCRGSIVLDIIETYPNELIIYLEKFSKLPSWHDPDFMDNLAKLLKFLNPKIAYFHNTNLVQEEIDQIREFGLVSSNSIFIKDRINLVHRLGLIEDAEYELLNKEIAVATQNPFEKTYVVLSSSTIWDDSGAVLLLSIWGGESIYWRIMNHPLYIRDKFLDFGKPCIVIGSVHYDRLDESKIVESIHNFYSKLVIERRDRMDVEGRETSITGKLTNVTVLVEGDGKFEQICDVIRQNNEFRAPKSK